jgi:copper homeostasis protein
MPGIKLEIAVFDVHSAGIAADAGASRLELCAGAPDGGLTPSAGMLQTVKELVYIPVFVMLRPRAGDFCYLPVEKDVIRKDLKLMRKLGADGFVFGALLPDHHVDVDFVKEIVSLAHPMPVTFHRAIDRCSDPLPALHQLADAGVKTILSSGLETDALKGASRLAHWKSVVAGKLEIMPGAGIHDGNAAEVAGLTGASWLHLSAKIMRGTAASLAVKMGSGDTGGFQSVNPDIIRNIISLGL